MIFGIGYSKTGTTSLDEALKMLGLKSLHNHSRVKQVISKNQHTSNRILSGLEHYDALMDTPIFNIYKELDKQYPGSKFILTVRDSDDWKQSMRKHALRYNWNDKTLSDHLHSYISHDKEVFEYFEDRKNDLLVMDIIAGDGWKKLCPFLEMEIPKRRFPHMNKKNEKKDLLNKGIRKIKRIAGLD